MRSLLTEPFYAMPNRAETPSLDVLAHPAVLGQAGWVGYARRRADGILELHPTSDTVMEPLESVSFEAMLTRDVTLKALQSLPARMQAWRWDREAEFQLSRLPAGPTYFFQVEVSPGPGNPERANIGGAIVSCWIRIETATEASEIVTRKLSDLSWIIKSVSGPRARTEADYDEHSEGGGYFQQAQIDGEVFVFHTFAEKAYH